MEVIYYSHKNEQTLKYKGKQKLLKVAKICGFGELK